MPTILAQAPSQTVPENTLITVPANNFVSVPSNVTFSMIQLAVNLPLAVKLAAVDRTNGPKCKLLVFVADDSSGTNARFVAGLGLYDPGQPDDDPWWYSYGPAGIPARPQFGIPANPDPTVNVRVEPLLGKFIQLQTEFIGITTAGVTITGLP